MATTPQTPPTVPNVAPAPDPALPSQQFDSLAWNFTLSLSPFKQGMDQLAANVYDNATVAYSTSLAASTSASTATTAANTATQKAADATTAATTAAQRLADIEALYDQFDDRYLGVKATDPTVDNDGNALQAGALYINSASGTIRAYTGTTWVQGISATAGVTAINGQQGSISLVTVNGQPLTGSTNLALQVPLIFSGVGQNIAKVNGLPLNGADIVIPSGGGVSGGEQFSTSLIKETARSNFTLASDAGSYASLQRVGIDANRAMFIVAGSSGIHAAIYDNSDKTFGSWTLVRSGYFINNNYHRAVLADVDKVLICSVPSSSTAFQAVVCSVSAKTITVNTAASLTLAASLNATYGFGDDVNHCGAGIVNVNGSFVVTYGKSTPFVNALAMTVSGTAVTIGTPVTVNANEMSTVPMLHYLSGNAGAICGVVVSGDIWCRPFTVSGSTITLGTQATVIYSLVTTAGYVSTKLNSGRIAFVVHTSSTDSGKACIFTITSNVASASSTAVLGSIGKLYATKAIGNQLLYVQYHSSNFHQAQVLTDNAGTAVLGTVLTFGGTSSTYLNAGNGSWYSDATSLMFSTGRNNSYALMKLRINGNNPQLDYVTQLASSNQIDLNVGAVQGNGIIKQPEGVLYGASVAVNVGTAQNGVTKTVRLCVKPDGTSSLTAINDIAYLTTSDVVKPYARESDSATWGLSYLSNNRYTLKRYEAS